MNCKTNFYKALLASIVNKVSCPDLGIHDHLSSPQTQLDKIKNLLRNSLDYIMMKIGVQRCPNERAMESWISRIDRYMSNVDVWDHVYQRLSDDKSKEVYIHALCHRLLGERYVAIVPSEYTGSSMEYYQWRENELKKNVIGNGSLPGTKIYLLPDENGQAIKLELLPRDYYLGYLPRHYMLRRENVTIDVEPGDHVIDGGAYWGDSALSFSALAGAKGKVYAFEFEPRNLRMLKWNMSCNPGLPQNIEIMEFALWDKSGETLKIICEELGGDPLAARVGAVAGNSTALSARTVCIDDLLENGKITRLDFLKLDVEGAEPRVLFGAMKTIKKFKPKLAIAIYHTSDQMYEIPKLLMEWDLGYKFYVKHNSTNLWDTVLMAKI